MSPWLLLAQQSSSAHLKTLCLVSCRLPCFPFPFLPSCGCSCSRSQGMWMGWPLVACVCVCVEGGGWLLGLLGAGKCL